MRNFILPVFAILICLPAAALSQPQACALVEQIKLKVAVVTSNIANIDTTRTPEGGPYRIREFVCADASCEVKSKLQTKTVYDPNHIDANEDGYVIYPYMDLDDQISQLVRLSRDYDRVAPFCFTADL